MGMFDYVEYETNCSQCGEPLEGFQSKDFDCNLETITPDKVDIFYTSCKKCGEWHTFKVNKVCTVQSIEEI